MEIELGIEGALTAIYGVAKLAGRAIPIVGAAGLAYSYGQSVTNYITNAPKGSYRPVLANPLVTSGMLMYENFEDTLEFTDGDGGNNYISIPQSEQTTKLPSSIDFKVMGRIDHQGHGDIVSAYFDIDPNAGKPKVLSTPIPYQPKSILFTPDDRGHLLEWSKLPGFSPSMVKIWQEGFDVHKTDWKDSILEKRKDKSIIKPQASKFKNTSAFGMPDPGDLEPDDDEFSHFKKKDGSNRYECEKSESPQWQEAKPYKGYGGKYRYNGLNGKDREYYRWDHKHKDIEVYDNNFNKLGSRDPVTGKLYRNK